MQRLPSGTKAALVFYVIFAILLFIIHSWPATILANATVHHGPFFSDPNGTIDLVPVLQTTQQSWRDRINQEGFQPEQLIQYQNDRYYEKKRERSAVKWAYSENRLMFQTSPDESNLVRLAMAWKALMQKNGFAVDQTHWGFAQQSLWLKLSALAEVEVSGLSERIPIAEITFIQPLRSDRQSGWNFQGLIPMAPPILKKSVAAVQQKPSPITQPGISIPQVPIATPPKVPGPQFPKFKARLAIIIDDVGYERAAAEAYFAIKEHLTWAVLPFTPYGSEYLAAGKEHGFETILHLPLEPISEATNNPGPGVIKDNWSESEIIKQLDEDLNNTPGVVGINNHMGSAGTTDARLMDILMQQIKKRNLFFVDSRTIAHSLAPYYARKYGLPFAENQVFIDDSNRLEDKKQQIRELISLALKNGEAVGIGHARPGTADALIEMLPEIEKAGIVIVPVSQLVK